MQRARFIFSSAKQRFTTSNLFHRNISSRKVQSHNFSDKSSKGPRNSKLKSPLVNVEQPKKQPSRFPYAFVAIPAVLLGGLYAYIYYNDQQRGSHNVGVNRRCVDDNTIGGPFTLLDTENRVVTEKDFLGKWTLLYFGYTFSPDVGPEQVGVMAKAIDILEKKKNRKVTPVFVTIDPVRDNPSHLRAYLREFDPRIIGLTGPVRDVRQTAQEYRVFFRKVEDEGGYLVDCSNYMYLINPKLEVSGRFGLQYSAEELSEEIYKEVEKLQ